MEDQISQLLRRRQNGFRKSMGKLDDRMSDVPVIRIVDDVG